MCIRDRLRIALDLDAPALIIRQMPVEAVELHACGGLDESLQIGDREKVTHAVEHEACLLYTSIPQAGYESRVQYHIAHGKQGNPFCSLWPFAGYLYVCGPAAQIAIPVNHSQIRYTAENLSTTSHRPCTGHTLFVIFYRASSFLSSDIPARSSFSIWLHSSCAASILAASATKRSFLPLWELSLIHI